MDAPKNIKSDIPQSDAQNLKTGRLARVRTIPQRAALIENRERSAFFARWCARASACKFPLRTRRILPGELLLYRKSERNFL